MQETCSGAIDWVSRSYWCTWYSSVLPFGNEAILCLLEWRYT